ncbi:U-box domain-containing protein 25 [Bienertia sinuspersici]
MEECDAKVSLGRLSIGGSSDTQMENLIDSGTHLNYQFRSMSVLEILRETVRILRYNCGGFMAIAALLICPVSAVQLSNLLVDHSIVRRLTIRLLLIARTSGLPLNPIVKQSCQKFSEMAVSTVVCFLFYVTLSLLSKAAVVYSVDCTYSKKQFDASKFCVIVSKLWKRVVVTYVWACMVIVGVVTLFLVLLIAICNVFLVSGFIPDLVVYPGIVVGLVFSVVFANAIIICNIAVVISVLEDASGPQALLRSSILIRGQTQVGLLMYLGSTIGMAFVQGLFEHRVKTLSYGDGSSRIWEGPLLVIMYSFVVLIDYMMTAVFYFSCRSYSMEAANEEAQSILEMVTATPKSNPVDCESAAA